MPLTVFFHITVFSVLSTILMSFLPHWAPAYSSAPSQVPTACQREQALSLWEEWTPSFALPVVLGGTVLHGAVWRVWGTAGMTVCGCTDPGWPSIQHRGRRANRTLWCRACSLWPGQVRPCLSQQRQWPVCPFSCQWRAVNHLFVSVEIGFIRNGIKKQVNDWDAFLEDSYLVPGDDRACCESWALSRLGNSAVNKVCFCVIWEYSLSKLTCFSWMLSCVIWAIRFLRFAGLTYETKLHWILFLLFPFWCCWALSWNPLGSVAYFLSMCFYLYSWGAF